MEMIQKIEKKIYFNKENKFFIGLTEEGIIVKGTINEEDPRSLIGIKVKFYGNWKKYKGEDQFVFKYYELLEEENLEYFFKNYLGAGIPKYIEKIMNHFSIEEIKEIMSNDEFDKFTEVKGIGNKTIEKIRNKYKLYNYNKILIQCLSPYGATLSIIKKIYDGFIKKHIKEEDEELVGILKANEICQRIKDNPYIITKIEGIGFKTADNLALNMGIKEDDEIRIKAGINYSMDEYIKDKGNTLISSDELFHNVQKILITDKKDFILTKEIYNKNIDEMILNKEIISLEDTKGITLPKYLKYEEFIYEKFWNKQYSYSLNIDEQYINRKLKLYEKINNIKLDEKQVKSVKEFLLSNDAVNIISGYAGTGKTTIAKFIIETFKDLYKDDDIIVCALAGSAANRIKVVTKVKNASTIHSLLGYKRKGDKFEFEYNESKKLSYKLIIVDEASMIDSSLFYHLFRAIDFKRTKVLIIGDPGQLPPVGSGSPFEDILNLNNIVHKNQLTKIFRQNPLSVLTLFANKIRKGEVPEKYDEEYIDFEYKNFSPKNYFALKNKLTESELKKVKIKTKLNIAADIKKWFLEKKEDLKFLLEIEDYVSYLQEFQVISPMKDKMLGVIHFNKMIQYILNVPEDEIEYKFAYDIIIPILQSIDIRTYEVKSYKKLNSIRQTLISNFASFKYTSKINDYLLNNQIKELVEFLLKLKRTFEKEYNFIITSKEVFLKNDRVLHLSNKYMYCMDYQDYLTEDFDSLYFRLNNAYENREEDIENKIYETRVYNGQSGIILNHFWDEQGYIKYIAVYYPFENIVVFYKKNDFRDEIIGLNYAMTIHKSQGQEYKNVFIPISGQHFKMLNNRLLYTAITRAKEKCYIYAEDWAFKKACKNVDDAKRKTILQKMAKEN